MSAALSIETESVFQYGLSEPPSDYTQSVAQFDLSAPLIITLNLKIKTLNPLVGHRIVATGEVISTWWPPKLNEIWRR